MLPGEPSKYTYTWYIEQFKEAKSHAKNLASETNNKLLTKNPAPDQWSAIECINHLVQFGNIYYKNISREIEDAGLKVSDGPGVFKPRLMWRGIIRLFEPPYKLKVKTIAIFEPSKLPPRQNGDAFAAFFSLQNRFVDQLERCRQQGISLDKEKIGNPALPFLKMRLSECYGVIGAHQRRHLWQAQQTLDQISE